MPRRNDGTSMGPFAIEESLVAACSLAWLWRWKISNTYHTQPAFRSVMRMPISPGLSCRSIAQTMAHEIGSIHPFARTGANVRGSGTRSWQWSILTAYRRQENSTRIPESHDVGRVRLRHSCGWHVREARRMALRRRALPRTLRLRKLYSHSV